MQALVSGPIDELLRLQQESNKSVSVSIPLREQATAALSHTRLLENKG